MNIDIVKVGMPQTNCYILNIDSHVLIIDPGDEIEKIMKVVDNNIIDGVIITHNHFDHIGAKDNFDKDRIYDFNNLVEGINKIGVFEFEIIYTPGHKEDSISIYFCLDKVLFCGDFIFYESIGRTDLIGGNIGSMLDSISKTDRFDDDVIIYPGHGNSTTFKHERKYNEYFNIVT